MPQVAAQKTPLTQAQALGALLAAGCPQSALLMAAAQSAVETAGWQSMFNYDAGNITSANPNNESWFLQGSNAIRFKSYADATSGFGAFISWLSSRGLLAYATANDLPGYVSQLRANCYLGCIGRVDANGTTVSQTDYDNYQAGIAAWMKKLQGVTPVAPPAAKASVPWGALLIGAGIVGGGFAAAHFIRKSGSGSGILSLAESNESEETDEANEKKCKDSSVVQTLLFPRANFTRAEARVWAREHGFKASKIDEKIDTFRLRQHPPEEFERMRTITLDKDREIKAVVGWRNC